MSHLFGHNLSVEPDGTEDRNSREAEGFARTEQARSRR